MLAFIQSLIDGFYAATKESPLLAAAAMPVVAAFLYLLRDTPKRIVSFVKRQTTVTMSLNNAGWDGNIDAFNAFDKWFMQSGYSKWSRRFFLFRQYERRDDGAYLPFRIGVGSGMHFFLNNGKLFWFAKGNLESSGSEKQKEEIVITTFGRSAKAFESLVALFNKPRQRGEAITVHNWAGTEGGWQEVSDVVPKRLDAVCIDRDLRDDIKKQIDDFTTKKDMYRRKGLTYKLSMLFHGPAGTGKTSLCKSIAGHYKKDLYILDLTTQTNSTLLKALSSIRPGSIILMEDVDQAGSAVLDREKAMEDKANDPLAFMEYNPLTMSGLLNALDGVLNLDNVIIFMTTNHPELLDAAVKRKSRIDYQYEIDVMTEREVADYVSIMYDENQFEMEKAQQLVLSKQIRLPGCEVENAYKENFDDAQAFIAEIMKRGQVAANDEVQHELKMAAE